jgi:hypothetical protein
MHYVHRTWMYDEGKRTQFFARIVVRLGPVPRDGISGLRLFVSPGLH